ncbi:MAG TPA: S8 family serine peptidase [Opitutaceae bacterium]|nr:S8 family serine peptidase [Opitutaceae bacterium]
MFIANTARATLSRANDCNCYRRATGWASQLSVCAAALAMLMACAPSAEAQSGSRRPERILVKPKGKDGANAAASAIYGSRVRRVFPQVGDLQVIELPAGMPAQTALNLLKQTKEIAYAEADHVLKLQSTTPSDVRFGSGELWGLHNTGLYGGTPGADIKAPEGWDIRTSAPNVIVALVDSGVRMTHQDLAPNLWTNPGEIPGNGIDDDRNGVIDDVHGYNAWAENGDPTDDLGHGTHVAGTIGAAGNNGVGVVGVAWKVQLMVTKFTDPTGNGTISDAIECIDYVRRMGAQVINASWGATWFDSAALRDAIASARDAGIIFVTVSSNGQGGNNDTTPVYPAGYDLDNIVVATATDRNDQLAFFANYGPRSVDLGAPGYNIFSTWNGSDTDYAYYDGGSMAVAHVTGAVALVRAHFPGEDYRKIIQRVLSGTDPLPSLAGKTTTGGRLNLFKALGGSMAPPTVSVAATDAAAAEAGTDPAVFTITRTGATTAPLSILSALGGTAANGSDYQTLRGTVTIPAGAAAAAVTVQPIDDTQFEGSETVTLTLSAAATYTTGTASATATIADNDAAPLPTVSVAATDPNAAEAGPDSATFTVTRTGATTAALSVSFTLGGTATNGTDYQTLATSVVIPAGAASATVVVRPIDDTAVEDSETVVLTLAANAAYAISGPSSATATIADNDKAASLPTVSISASIPLTIEMGLWNGQFTISRTGNTAQALTVRLAVSGTAAAGADYARIADTVTIPAGRSSATVAVDPLRDRAIEPTETIIVTVAPHGAYDVGSANKATVYLFDDDALFAFLAQWRGRD